MHMHSSKMTAKGLKATLFVSRYYDFFLYVLSHSEGYMSILGSGFSWYIDIYNGR